ncbi:MAG: hypothetical protein JJE04_06315 [Acidobacteriia bacterium]|nr:hypothetical protein [Terriglobia bacterium]
MPRLLQTLVLVLSLLAVAPAQKQKKQKDDGPKPPDIAVLEFKVHREPRLVVLQGALRNNSAKTIRGLVLFFEFLEGDGKMITRKTTIVTDTPMAPGQESGFEVQTVDPVRAVQVRVDAEDKDGRYLRLDNPGPFDIE